MRGFKKLSILLVSILLSFSTITSANSVEEICQIVPDNTYIGDPTNCAGWALCINNIPEYVGQCTNSQLFNSHLGVCDWADDVTCASTNVNTICTGLNGVYKANPINCQSYCYCQNGVAGCSLCPNGLVFNPLTSSCVASSAYSCADSSPCAMVPNNVLVQNVDSCSSYYQCSNGASIAGTCYDGYMYNAITGACDYPSNVVCSGASNPGSPPSPPSPPSIPSVPSPPSPPSSGDNNLPPSGSSMVCASLTTGQLLVNDGATCQGYFYCANGASTAQPVWEECPNGSHFSQSQQQCVSPYSVACPYNRCEGLSYTFVAVLNTNCRDYYVCNNGATKWNSEAGCPESFPYFDEFRQACVPNEPNYAVCY